MWSMKGREKLWERLWEGYISGPLLGGYQVWKCPASTAWSRRHTTHSCPPSQPTIPSPPPSHTSTVIIPPKVFVQAYFQSTRDTTPFLEDDFSVNEDVRRPGGQHEDFQNNAPQASLKKAVLDIDLPSHQSLESHIWPSCIKQSAENLKLSFFPSASLFIVDKWALNLRVGNTNEHSVNDLFLIFNLPDWSRWIFDIFLLKGLIHHMVHVGQESWRRLRHGRPTESYWGSLSRR